MIAKKILKINSFKELSKIEFHRGYRAQFTKLYKGNAFSGTLFLYAL